VRLNAIRDEGAAEDYVEIRYRELTPAIHEIIRICQGGGVVLLCEQNDAIHQVDINDVLYIEWVDGKSCIYTRDAVFTMGASLAALEERLKNSHFVRISKMSLANVFKIRSISNGLNFRLTAEMINGEKIVISRHYRRGLLDAIHNLAKEVVK